VRLVVIAPTICYHVRVENRIASLVVDATDAELLAQRLAAGMACVLAVAGCPRK
jgi:hypothetical protein